MRIGTIGAGEVALAVAREALAQGHEVVLSSRSGPGALADKVSELGRGASAATVEEAASLDYVLLAVPWRNVEAALQGLPGWSGRVLIDATNPFVETSPRLILADLGGIGASEIVARFAQARCEGPDRELRLCSHRTSEALSLADEFSRRADRSPASIFSSPPDAVRYGICHRHRAHR